MIRVFSADRRHGTPWPDLGVAWIQHNKYTGVGVVAAVEFEVVTLPAVREALLGAPEIARRLGSVPINIHDRHTHFLQSPDGPAVISKRGLREYWLLASGLERADPHVHRLIDWVF